MSHSMSVWWIMLWICTCCCHCCCCVFFHSLSVDMLFFPYFCGFCFEPTLNIYISKCITVSDNAWVFQFQSFNACGYLFMNFHFFVFLSFSLMLLRFSIPFPSVFLLFLFHIFHDNLFLKLNRIRKAITKW